MRDSWWARWRLTILTAALVLAALSALLVHPAAMGGLGVFTLTPVFADLFAVLAAGEAAGQGIDVYAGNPLDPLGRPHVYGPAWLWLGKLGLARADVWWLGGVLAIVFVGVASVVFAPRRAGAVLFAIAALLSPPVLLAVERGNNDLVIFLLFACAAWIAGGVSTRWRLWLGAGGIAWAAVLKFYPIVSLIAVFGGRGSWRSKLAPLLFGAALFLAAWIGQHAEITRVLQVTPKPVTIYCYGWSGFVLFWNLVPTEHVWLLLGAVPPVLVGAWWLWRGLNSIAATLPTSGSGSVAAVAGGASWVLCYAMTTNFPYRAVLLLLVLPALLRAEAPRASHQLAWLHLGTWWLSTAKFWCAQAATQGIVGWWSIAVVFGVEQALVLVGTLGVCIVLLGWLVRQEPAIGRILFRARGDGSVYRSK